MVCGGVMRPRLRAAQDDLQPVHPVEPDWRVQQDFRGAGAQGGKIGSVDDRCHSSQGPSDCGQSAQKGAVPRRIGRTKGGLNSKLHAVWMARGGR